MGDWNEADSIDVAIALDGWRPTLGTRRTGDRNTSPRVVLAGGELVQLQTTEPASWHFSESFGTQTIAEIPFTETILMAQHLRVREIHNYLNETSLRDVRDPATGEPAAADERGRSDQRFLIEVVVRNGSAERRLHASGRDIYAITAPLVVEVLERVCAARPVRSGAFAPGLIEGATHLLAALERRGDLRLSGRETLEGR